MVPLQGGTNGVWGLSQARRSHRNRAIWNEMQHQAPEEAYAPPTPQVLSVATCNIKSITMRWEPLMNLMGQHDIVAIQEHKINRAAQREWTTRLAAEHINAIVASY